MLLRRTGFLFASVYLATDTSAVFVFWTKGLFPWVPKSNILTKMITRYIVSLTLRHNCDFYFTLLKKRKLFLNFLVSPVIRGNINICSVRTQT